MTTDNSDWYECPYHQGPVVSPCQLEKCDMWEGRLPLCCAYVAYKRFAKKRPDEDLSWDVVGKMLGISANKAEKLAQQAYEQVRQELVEETVTAEWSLVKNPKRCVVCSKPAEYFEQGWGWCSESCYEWLPPAAVEAESRWGVRFGKLLSQWKNLNVKTIERLTGLDKEMIQWLFWQHLGHCFEDTDDMEPLVANPCIPTAEEILQRLEASRKWVEEAL